MLLLLLLLNESTRKRILIDALLCVCPWSQASICRDAGVPAASLSRFRKLGGEGQISEQKQDQLLIALGMSEGQLLAHQVHIWEVDADTRAVEWLLRTALGSSATLAMIKPNPTSRSGFRTVLVGRAGQARLIIRSRRAPLSRLLADDMSRPFRGRRDLRLDAGAVSTLCQRHISVTDFDATVGSLRSSRSNASERAELCRQLQLLGMTDQQHQKLLMEWLIRRARTMPSDLEARLEHLDVLELDTGAVTPSKMTPAQRRRLVEKLSRRHFERSHELT